MKKLIILLVNTLIVLSCAGPQYVTRDVPPQPENIDIREVLVQSYPDLVRYYDEGVLQVTSVRRNGKEIGLPNYIVKYKFVKYYYNYVEASSLLREKYPSLYEEYLKGRVRINCLYKYVDGQGVIQYCVSYRWVHAPYYTYRVVYHPKAYYWRYHRPPMSRSYKAITSPSPKRGGHRFVPHSNHAPAQHRGGRR